MMKKNCKWIALGVCASLLMLVMAGCMTAPAPVTPTEDPSLIPGVSDAPIGVLESMMPDAGATNMPAPFDWLQLGRTIEDKINMISEIQKGRIIVSGNTALVGVEFASQYQGEMTQRIRDMVASEVQQADANISTVAVTAETEDVARINQLADQIAAGTPVSELQADIDLIIRNTTTIQ